MDWRTRPPPSCLCSASMCRQGGLVFPSTSHLLNGTRQGSTRPPRQDRAGPLSCSGHDQTDVTRQHRTGSLRVQVSPPALFLGHVSRSLEPRPTGRGRRLAKPAFKDKGTAGKNYRCRLPPSSKAGRAGELHPLGGRVSPRCEVTSEPLVRACGERRWRFEADVGQDRVVSRRVSL